MINAIHAAAASKPRLRMIQIVWKNSQDLFVRNIIVLNSELGSPKIKEWTGNKRTGVTATYAR